MSLTQPCPVYLVAGPTASGKTAHALQLAAQHNGCVINADAMQVYADLPILTAQPTPDQLNAAPHVLYQHISPIGQYSVGQWLADAHTAIETALQKNQTPILAGGTGMYFDAIQKGIAKVPDIPSAIRETVREEYAATGPERFRQKLSALDPVATQKILGDDAQRLCRAMEVIQATGKPLHEWQKNVQFMPPPHWQFKHVLLWPDRAELYARLNARFEDMLRRGALDEVKNFLSQNPSATAGGNKIIGVPELSAYLNGEMSLCAATEKAQQATRNYAKRQYTWFGQRWREKQRA